MVQVRFPPGAENDMRKTKLLIGVIGGHRCSHVTARRAYEVGKGIAALGAILVCGGLGGVMKAAAQGSKENGGVTVGILPGEDKRDANTYIDIPIATGLGYTRNTLVTSAVDIIVAFAGKYGTLSEIGFALNAGKRVIGLGSWRIKGVIGVKTPREALAKIKQHARNL